jgi:hypothetical protein
VNENPHSHTPVVKRKYDGLGQGGFLVEYGDQRVFVKRHRWWFGDGVWIDHRPPHPKPVAVARALAKAIRLHDHGSVAHHRYDEVLRHGAEPNQWASDVRR